MAAMSYNNIVSMLYIPLPSEHKFSFLFCARFLIVYTMLTSQSVISDKNLVTLMKTLYEF